MNKGHRNDLLHHHLALLHPSPSLLLSANQRAPTSLHTAPPGVSALGASLVLFAVILVAGVVQKMG